MKRADAVWASGVLWIAACGTLESAGAPDGTDARASSAERAADEVADEVAQEVAVPTEADARIASERGVEPLAIARLRSERRLDPAHIQEMSAAELTKSIRKLDVPKAAYPGQAAQHRARQRLRPDGTPPRGELLAAKAQRDALAARGSKQNAAGVMPASWEWLGPGNLGGRVRGLLVHPGDPDVLWAGSASGGLWKSLDGGDSWAPLDDFMANLAIACLVLDPADPDNLYAGTGEGVFQEFEFPVLAGAGVFRSTDGGATWAHLASTSGPEWSYVNRLSIHPGDSQILLAATNAGIFRSTDAGGSWSQRTTSTTYDVKFQPSNGARAAAGLANGTAYSTDGGVTWSLGTGATGGRVEVAWAPNVANGIYASVDFNQGQVWRSANGGQTWVVRDTNTGHLQMQGWYDNAIWVDPTDSNHVVVGGVDLWRSTNGGVDFTRISEWWNWPLSAHADHHAIVAHPGYDGSSNRTVFFGNDGGVWRADDVAAAAGTSGWTDRNHLLGITQFYGGVASSDPAVILGGTQDHGTLRFSGDPQGWTQSFGGDGGFCAADPSDPDVLYAEFAVLKVLRSTDGGQTFAPIGGLDTDLVTWKSAPYLIGDALNGQANFVAPLVLDPNDGARLYAGGRSLWRSTDPLAANTSTTGPQWTNIKGGSGSNYISAIAVARGDSDVVWVGHDDGDVYQTSNGTSATPIWSKMDDNGGTPLPERWCARLVVDPNDHDTVWASFMGYADGNVWVTHDAGSSWQDASGSAPDRLPALPVSALALHPAEAGWVYAGTDLGVFASEDGGATWTTSNDGPANVSVDELVFADHSRLLAVTHGRGVYRADVGPWTDLGGGTSGEFGVPVLLGDGPLTDFSPISLSLTNAPDLELMLLWIAVTSEPLSIFGGTIYAVPFAEQFLFGTDRNGAFLAATSWPPAIPSGTPVWFQFLIQDFTVPHGITLSNAVLGTTP